MKTELRKKYKLLRKKITLEKREVYSKAIFNIIESEFDIKNKNVSIFLPIEKFEEINTWHLIDSINANFFVPVVKSKDLIHIKYENKTQLKTSDWGIDEPLFGEETIPSNFDFVIVPLLAYDVNGNRIGYGAGFYDHFLKDCNPECKFIGISFFDAEINVIDTFPSDIPLHYCVTPKGIMKF